jgi:asparagine synthase (glutamine-hydrolysing)
MCGIVGAVSRAPIETKLIEQMRDRLLHRGPDHGGLWSSDDRCVSFGHRRLAIIDLSPEANQPFISHDGRFVITFNGEIYNFRALRQQLGQRGIRFRTNSDTEVLVEAFREWGDRSLDLLSGMFAFAIWDNKAHRLFCARDRVGEKPFYYANVDGNFIFASELKSILLWPGFRKEIDYTAVVDFLSFGFVAEPKSIWTQCRKLPAGHSMSVEVKPDRSLSISEPAPYWDMQFDPDHSVKNWTPQILETLEKASKEMSFADVAVGTFLSGGVDSSSVAAALSRAGCDVKTFTIGFDEQGFDERPYAREVAARYNTEHTERNVVAEDVTAEIEQLLWHYDEPFNDYSYLPTFQVCREARKTITVALSGDGGDEMFAGYRKYQRLGFRQQIDGVTPRFLSTFIARHAGMFRSESSRFRRTLFQYASAGPELMLDSLSLGMSVPALHRAARGELAETLKHYSPMNVIEPLLMRAPPEKVGFINSMRYLDLKLTLAGDILVKVDRASMAVALEVRPVYLHRDMIALAERIPSELLADRTHTKEVLKEALKAWLPESILYRRKQGFAMPLRDWINGNLRHLFANTKKSPVDDFLDPGLLESMTRAHAAGDVQTTSIIHSLFFLNRWIAKWA